MNGVINGQFYNKLLENDHVTVIFPTTSFIKFYRTIGAQDSTVLYQDLCYNE